MLLHDANWERARARSRRSSLHSPRSRALRAGLFATSVALLIACGDDGTESLSSCPDFKIALNKNNELTCAPKMPAAGAGAKTTPAANTGANSQANTATKPAASGNPAGAASSGSAGNAPSVPKGPWSCLQVMDTCSCVPNSSDLGDNCRKPHPTCCNLVMMNNRVVGCLCVPTETDQCVGMQKDPTNFPRVSQCPP